MNKITMNKEHNYNTSDKNQLGGILFLKVVNRLTG